MKHVANVAIIRGSNSEIRISAVVDYDEMIDERISTEPGDEILEVAKVELDDSEPTVKVWTILQTIHEIEKDVGAAVLIHDIFESGFRAGQRYPKP